MLGHFWPLLADAPTRSVRAQYVGWNVEVRKIQLGDCGGSRVMRGDVVVIGSGPIGAVVARRFAEAGRAVTMLEAGPAISDPPGCHVRNQARFQHDPDSFLAGIADRFTYFDEAAAPAGLPGASTTAAVGGQGVLWTNNCPRPSPFQQWAAMPAPDWDHYLGEAERYLDVHDDTFAASLRQQRIAERLRAPLAEAGRGIRAQPMAGRLLGPTTTTIHYAATHDVLVDTGVVVQAATCAASASKRNACRQSSSPTASESTLRSSWWPRAPSARRFSCTARDSERRRLADTSRTTLCCFHSSCSTRGCATATVTTCHPVYGSPQCRRTLEHDGVAGYEPHTAGAARH